MDPDVALAHLLDLAHRYAEEPDEEAAEEIASRLIDLDLWIAKGGFLPQRWQKSRSQLVLFDDSLRLPRAPVYTPPAEPRSTNGLLSRLRWASATFNDFYRTQGDTVQFIFWGRELADLFRILDNWLRRGEPLPDDWRFPTSYLMAQDIRAWMEGRGDEPSWMSDL